MNRHVVRALPLLAAAAVLLGVLTEPVSAALKTTAPGTVYIIKVTLTNTAIVIPKDKFSVGLKYPRYPRGALIQYRFTNRGTRPYSVKMWVAKTGVISPGHSDSVLVDWNYRGMFKYETLYRGKPSGPHGFVSIF
jgi:hypothetical protein